MMMIHLSETPPNMSSIEAVWDSCRKTFLTLLDGILRVTGGIRVNSYPVKVKLVILLWFLPEGIPILLMTGNAVRGTNIALFH